MPGQGLKSFMQLEREAVYGTYIVPTRKLEIISANIVPVIGVIQDPSLYNAPSRRGIYQGGLLFKGNIVMRANYDGLIEIFRGLTGVTGTSPAGYQVSTVETGVRDHKFSESSAQLPSYSIDLVKGDVPTGKCFRLTGAKFINLPVRGRAGVGAEAMVTCEVTVIAKDMLSNQNLGASLSFPALLPVIYHQSGGSGVIDDGTADAAASVRIRSFEVTLEQPHTEDRYYMGSVNIDEPLRADFLTARWRLEQEFTTQTQFDAARAFTVGSPRLMFQHPTTIGATSKREFELRSDTAQLVDFSDPVDGPSILISTATWEAVQDASALTALFARFRNTEAALT